MQNKCCLCDSMISINPREQHPLRTSFGYLCNKCISKGHWEKIQYIKTKEQFEEYKLLEKGLI